MISSVHQTQSGRSLSLSKFKAPHILVCGGREFTDYEKLSDILDRLCLERDWYYGEDASGETNWLPNVVVVSGCARGADILALNWAATNWCPTLEYPADWLKHGRAAGPIRNQQMLDEGKPDIVVAFPGGRGTADMIARARKAGIEVLEIE